MRAFRLLVLPVIVGLGGLAAPAGADVSVGLTGGTKLAADGGAAAWRTDAGRLAVRIGGGAPTVTRLTLPRGDFDVGRRPGGGARLVYPAACSTARRSCEVRVIDLVSSPRPARVLTRIPFRGGRPAVAIDRDVLVHSVLGRTRAPGCGIDDAVTCLDPFIRCDTLEVRRLGSRRGRALDRGTCPEILSLDLQDRRLAVLAETQSRRDSFTEARILRTTGGPSLRLQRERASRSSLAGANDIGAVSLDGGALYTSVLGDEQPNRFVRFTLATGRRSDARAFGDLAGSFTRDGGRSLYGLDTAGIAAGGFGCYPAAQPVPCQIVAGEDPWRVPRRLLPTDLRISATPPGGRVRVGAPAAVGVLVTRERVTRTARAGRVPQAGVRVELLAGTVTGTDEVVKLPTGATAVTDADGRAVFPLDTAIPATRVFAVRLADRGAPVPASSTEQVEVRP